MEKPRPVLIPCFNSEQEIALELIIHDLIAGISKLGKNDLTRLFSKEILELFNLEIETGIFPFIDREGQKNTTYEYSWIKEYGDKVPDTTPLAYLSDKYLKYLKDRARGRSFSDIVASFERNFLRHTVKD